jgi:hypothetical protein
VALVIACANQKQNDAVPIRLRLVLFFTAASILTLVFGSWFFVVQLRSGLIGSLDANIAAQWSITAQNVPAQQGQESFQDGGGRAIGSTASAPATSAGTEYVVQILNRSDSVYQSNQAAGTKPLVNVSQLRQATRGALVTTTHSQENELIRLLAAPAVAGSRYIVLVGASLDSVNSTILTVRRDLVFAGLAIIVASALGSLLLATAALSPVERLRRQVSELSELDESVSVEVPRTNDEIAALARTMNALLGRLHEALVRQRAFVADAGHELRTPFAILQAELELAARPGRTKVDLQLALSNAAEEAARLSQLAEDLLFLARSDQVVPDLRVTHMRLKPILDSAAELVSARAETLQVILSVDAPEEIEGDFDPIRVRQALDNLVDNALNFAPTGSEVVLIASLGGNGIYITVVDRGPGFPEEYLPLAFERFRRPDDARARQDGGTGLGLAIVAAIANWHNGKAFVRNRTGGGAEVGFDIPDVAKREGTFGTAKIFSASAARAEIGHNP